MVSSTGFLERFTSPAAQVARQMYATALGNTLRYPWAIPDPSYALGKDANVYELIRHDAVIKHVMDLRRHMVAGTSRTCVVADGCDAEKREVNEKAAKLGTQMLREIGNLDSAVLNLAEAVFRGSAYAKIIGQRVIRTWVDGRPRRWWVPIRLADISRLRVRFVPDTKRGPLAGPLLQVASLQVPGQWDTVEHPEWLIQHVYDDQEDTLGYGRGLIDALYHYWYAKAVLLTEGLAGVERWARGLVKVHIDSKRAGSASKTNQNVAETTAARVAATMARHVLVFMDGEDAEVMQGPGQGHEMVVRFLQYLDDAIRSLILGSVLPSGGGKAVGSLARAEVEQETSADLIAFDRRLIEQTFSQQVIGLTWTLNRANIYDCGLALAEKPRVAFTSEPKKSPVERAESAVKLLGQGVPLVKTDLYESTGWRAPQPGDEVVEGRPEPTPFGGGFGMGFGGAGPPGKDGEKPPEPKNPDAPNEEPPKPDKYEHWDPEAVLDDVLAEVVG